MNCQDEKCIVYSDSTKKIISNRDDLITIHSHPDSLPPSIDDFNSNFDHGYAVVFVICHDGKLYMYTSNERIKENYHKLVVEDYIKSGYNEEEASLLALNELQANFNISFKEVTDENCI